MKTSVCSRVEIICHCDPIKGMTPLEYCQFLLCSPFNYTQTYFAAHYEKLSHDQINRALKRLDVTSSELWEESQKSLVRSDNGFILFDDTVLDKRHSFKIECARPQWSGNEHKSIMGIGVVTCVYVNPETQQFWAIDYRIYQPDLDGKTKLHHVRDMLRDCIEAKQLTVSTVLMDSWYADRELMLWIGDTLQKTYYTPVKKNRKIAEHRGQYAYDSVESLDWTESELENGKQVRLNDFPNEHKVQLYRVTDLPNRTDYIVTNAPLAGNQQATKRLMRIRWKIEEFHRELKQNTGIESCQCRKAISQRNHIGCAMLLWAKLKNHAYQSGQNLYQLVESQYTKLFKQLFQNPPLRLTA